MRGESALVVGKFAPLHAGHQLVLDSAFAEAQYVTVIVWSNPDVPGMPTRVRTQWISDLYPSATVISGEDGPPNDAPDHVHHQFVEKLLRAHGRPVDLVLTSEEYGEGLARALGARHVAVDPARTRVPISGTVIREDPHAHRAHLDPRVYAHFVERVAVLGAEGTGKSTLTEALAAHFETSFVAEYGRAHYEERAGELDLDDYVAIARRHRELEDEACLHAVRYLFADTNALTTMFFSHYYNRGSRPELRALAEDCRNRYRHVIVCDDDIPFEQDGWRDSELWRGRMQGMVLHDLDVRGIEYSIVRGSVGERIEQVAALLAGLQAEADVVPQRSLGPGPGRRGPR
jgi:HTH-type transcriptional regulator, transcriptional repressor of NAD biosynthesis genes